MTPGPLKGDPDSSLVILSKVIISQHQSGKKQQDESNHSISLHNHSTCSYETTSSPPVERMAQIRVLGSSKTQSARVTFMRSTLRRVQFTSQFSPRKDFSLSPSSFSSSWPTSPLSSIAAMPEDYYYSYSKNRSGHIPTFGDWDYTNDLPITQYFECARQAGLIRYSSSSGESDQRTATRTTHDLYAPPPRLQGRAREKRCPRVNEQRKASRICDAAQPQTRHRRAAHTDKLQHRDDAVLYNSRPRAAAAAKVRAPKAVDEDLYKIPPELLHSANRVSQFVIRPKYCWNLHLYYSVN
ncbi:hypothetical protein SAY87_025756 [Trapa incisa]|uniref:Uncharacterized protein n=1 Tax=Trapa incisa TaxID=236973 RepID=A0AAN7GR02_9MYRT|nr:hypothetical protein SAY87_025756 [Trapa incisa]